MSQHRDRLERLVAEELGECCETDLQNRVDSLRELQSTVEGTPDEDLQALTTLGNDTRYDIVRLLSAADRELCVCEITPILAVSDSAISHALSDLHEAGLVTRRKEGTWRYYGTTERAEALLDALAETRGGDEL